MFAFVTFDGRYLFFTCDKLPYLLYKVNLLTYDETTQMLTGTQNRSADIFRLIKEILEKYMTA
jgi:hypothetical protein